MDLPARLKRNRFGVYAFRFVIPKRLRPLFGGRTEIKRSLKTREPRTFSMTVSSTSISNFSNGIRSSLWT